MSFGRNSSNGAGFGQASTIFGASANQSGSELCYWVRPPELTGISDPKVIVNFKGLQKKDETTKVRALEDLAAYIEKQKNGPEDAILQAWASIFPRIVYDNSHKVREYAVSITGAMAANSKQRVNQYFRGIIAPWYSVLGDAHPLVSKAAQIGLMKFIDTPEKHIAFATKIQSGVLAFVLNVLRESRETLSDERVTKPEDMDSKHFRILHAGLSSVCALLKRVPVQARQAASSEYLEVLENDKIWGNINSVDFSVKRAACSLFVLTSKNFPEALKDKGPALKKILINEGLKTPHYKGVVLYLSCLSMLTEILGQSIWAASDKGGKSPISRLGSFVEKGSGTGNEQYWKSLHHLATQIPDNVWTLPYAIKFAMAFRKGMATQMDRLLVAVPWHCYNDICSQILKILSSNQQETQEFAQKALIPVLETALEPSKEFNQWTIHGPPYNILSETFSVLASTPGVESLVIGLFEKIASHLCEGITTSLPAVSSDHVASQEAVGNFGNRWFSFSGTIRKSAAFKDPFASAIIKSDMTILEKCMGVLIARNFNPFGASRVLVYAVENTDILQSKVSGLVPFLQKSGTEMLLSLLSSEATEDLVTVLHNLSLIDAQEHASYESIWKSWLDTLLSLPSDDQTSSKRLKFLLKLAQTEAGRTLAQNDPRVAADLVSRSSMAVTSSDPEVQNTLAAILSSQILSPATTVSMVNKLLDIIDSNEVEIATKIAFYRNIACSATNSLSLEKDLLIRFHHELLIMAETAPSELSAQAYSIHRDLMAKEPGGQSDFHVIPAIVQQSLLSAKVDSLGIKTLSRLCLKTVKSHPETLRQFLPPTDVWAAALKQLVNNIGLDPMLVSATSDSGDTGLYGLVPLVELGIGEKLIVDRDSFGRSLPARMALHVATLLHEVGVNLETMPELLETLLLLSMSKEIVSDQQRLKEEDQLFESSGIMCVDFLSKVNTTLTLVLKTETWSLIPKLIEVASQSMKLLDASSFYMAQGLLYCARVFLGSATAESCKSLFSSLDIKTVTRENVLVFSVVTRSCGSTISGLKSAEVLLNRLIAEIQVLKADNHDNMLAILAAIDALLGIYIDVDVPVPPSRFMFAFRCLTDMALADNISEDILGRVLYTLHRLLPNVLDMAGLHWSNLFQVIHRCFEQGKDNLADATDAVYQSLKLFIRLKEVVAQGQGDEEEISVNDDLVKAAQEQEESILKAAAGLLSAERPTLCPLQEEFDLVLSTAMNSFLLVDFSQAATLEKALGSENSVVQMVALRILRGSLPTLFSDWITDTILEKKTATISEVLIKHLKTPLSIDAYTDEELDNFPSSVRRYIYAWLLIFNQYKLLPISLRDDFTQSLRKNNASNALFDFTFFVLGHSTGNPINLEKEGIWPDKLTSYDVDPENQLKKPTDDLNRVYSHVYYLALQYIPELFRRWFIDTRSKATKKAVDEWTAQFISASIIDAVINEVVRWGEEQEKMAGADDVVLSIRVSKAAREITAGYQVDEWEATMVVRIPKNFPLGNVEVIGTNRVGVSDRQWSTWQRLVQGAITFSNGSIIEGLVLFRRNMDGTLKGQSECAICYAIVGEDKTMPNKKCGTCQKLFHKGCLYKWFQTSSQNTCPLCRNPIDYLGSDTQERRRRAQIHEF